MAKLIYSAICSLDGYINDATGNFDWAAPDEQVHAFVNDRERTTGTMLLGRGMYDTLKVWETMLSAADEPDVIRDFAEIWLAADKIVYSTTLHEVSTARTRLERAFDADAVRSLLAGAERDVSIGGPGLAAAAFRAGVVDAVQLYVNPVVVGGGTRALPDDLRLDLALQCTHTFDNGVVFSHYAVG